MQIILDQLPILFMFMSAVSGVLLGLLAGMDIIWTGRIRKWHRRRKRKDRKNTQGKAMNDHASIIPHIRKQEEESSMHDPSQGSSRLRKRMNDEMESDLSLICQEKEADMKTELRRYMSAQEQGYQNLKKHRKQ